MTQLQTIRTHTLGCKVNQYETELVREGLLRAGFRDAANDEPAGLCVVNTCTVTAEGDAKSRQVIRRLARDNPDSRIVVMGCYATRAPDELARLPQVVEVVTDKREIPDLLGRYGVIDPPDGISRFGDRHRAYVKVQDGCLLRCTYCIIPYVRPRMASRPVAAILDEVRRLADNGYREVVLTGIHLGHFGVDLNQGKPRSEWTRLASLVKDIVQIPGDFRIRLSSLEATEVTRGLLEVMAEFPDRVCPHLHICMQSGSDQVLRRMNRRWGARRFIDRCRLARETLDLPALTTDVIVGFPGETDDDFEATCRAIRACGFAKVHAFPFSARKGTPAASLSRQIDPTVRRQRMATLQEVERDCRTEFVRRLREQCLQVLVESSGTPLPGEVWGTACRYVPVRIRGSHAAAGDLIHVRGGKPHAAGIDAVVACDSIPRS